MKDNLLRVTGVLSETNKMLTLISKNSGKTKSELLRPILRKIVSEYPDDLKQKKDAESKEELQITGVAESVLTDLKTIAQNLGITPAQLVRTKLNDIIKEAPGYLKIKDDY